MSDIQVWWDGGQIYDTPLGKDCELVSEIWVSGGRFRTDFYRIAFWLMMAGF